MTISSRTYQRLDLVLLLGSYIGDFDFGALESAVTEYDPVSGTIVFTKEFYDLDGDELVDFLADFDLSTREHYLVTVTNADESVSEEYLVERFADETDARSRYDAIAGTWWDEYGSVDADYELWLMHCHEDGSAESIAGITRDDNIAAQEIVNTVEKLDDKRDAIVAAFRKEHGFDPFAE